MARRRPHRALTPGLRTAGEGTAVRARGIVFLRVGRTLHRIIRLEAPRVGVDAFRIREGVQQGSVIGAYLVDDRGGERLDVAQDICEEGHEGAEGGFGDWVAGEAGFFVEGEEVSV